jgi:hypothetical protein
MFKFHDCIMGVIHCGKGAPIPPPTPVEGGNKSPVENEFAIVVSTGGVFGAGLGGPGKRLVFTWKPLPGIAGTGADSAAARKEE